MVARVSVRKTFSAFWPGKNWSESTDNGRPHPVLSPFAFSHIRALQKRVKISVLGDSHQDRNARFAG